MNLKNRLHKIIGATMLAYAVTGCIGSELGYPQTQAITIAQLSDVAPLDSSDHSNALPNLYVKSCELLSEISTVETTDFTYKATICNSGEIRTPDFFEVRIDHILGSDGSTYMSPKTYEEETFNGYLEKNGCAFSVMTLYLPKTFANMASRGLCHVDSHDYIEESNEKDNQKMTLL